jgi:dihydrodipicolinate synthase/N-acetylneuraminate lyase
VKSGVSNIYQSAADPSLVVLAGTNGEAATLKIDEKVALVRKLRERAGNDLPITVGCIGGCTRDVIDDVVAMQDAGADFALVLVPSYFHFALDQAAVISYFEEVADASPLPICIYNFPTVVAGLDVNSEMLAKLGRHPNIVAVKLTCGGIGKVARVAADFPRESFVALAGQSDCDYSAQVLRALLICESQGLYRACQLAEVAALPALAISTRGPVWNYSTWRPMTSE